MQSALTDHQMGMSRMYAILFTLDSFALQAAYDGPDWREAYPKIHLDLTKRGFARQSEGFYLGGDTVDAVKCVVVVQALTQKYPWFASGVKDIRLVRVEEISDLRAAIDAVTPKQASPAKKALIHEMA